jgi:DNA ligase-1
VFELSKREGDSLTIENIFVGLKEIKEVIGKGSQEEKIRLLPRSYSGPDLKKENIYSESSLEGSGWDLETSFYSRHFLLSLLETKSIQEKSKRATVSALTLGSLQNLLPNMSAGLTEHFSINWADLSGQCLYSACLRRNNCIY